jgi:hypothetical protein
MRILLLQLDGKIPNIALMRISAHHKAKGDEVVFQQAGSFRALDVGLFDDFDNVYASLIFSRTRPLAEYLSEIYPNAIIGGTGWNVELKLEDIGITTPELDYSIYPRYKHSIGFTQRGCRLRCAFCCVPKKEGLVKEESVIAQIWRGESYPKHLLLLDNDFFGQPNWQKRIDEIRGGDFKVCLTQGINARMLTDETASAIASINYYDDQFKKPRVYTAWDNRKDEARLFAGLSALKKHGINPDNIMVYMLIGFWPGETAEDREYRRAKLRKFGCRPYPMPFFTTEEWREIFWKRTTPRIRELDGFKRFVLGAYDKRFSWSDWARAQYRPEKLGLLSSDDNPRLFEKSAQEGEI